MHQEISGLCVITDTTTQKRHTHLQLAELAMRGGASIIQLRDKHLSAKELFALAVAMRTLTMSFNRLFIVNDRADIARAADADGVHLGQTDLPIPAARKILGKGKIIGATASTLEEALAAEQQGADYIGFGHIFPTSSKEKPTPARGVAALQEVVNAVKIPVMAIGGITLENAASVLETGVQSLAVISAVSTAESPQVASAKLAALIKTYTELHKVNRKDS
jgi:thiamine-phosphate pyrophosphorylase